MQDRISVNPGRVLISPENGAAYYATMTRADNATQEGTPLNKNSLLRDATAALFGLGADAVPDDVFGVLSRFKNGLGNEYVWAKTKSEEIVNYTEVVGNEVNLCGNNRLVYYSDSFRVENEKFVLDNPATITLTHSNAALLRGKYCLPDGADGTQLYKPGESATTSTSGPDVWYTPMYRYMNITIKTSVVTYGYVNSPDPNAYPVDDGYTYNFLGQIGGAARIATGNYTGTGTYGASNKNKLVFDFEPKFVLITDEDISGGEYSDRLLWLPGVTKIRRDYGNTITVSVNGKTMSWYTATTSNSYPATANHQFNASGTKYYWIALG